MNLEPTVEQVRTALNELDTLMRENQNDPDFLDILSTLYAKAYCLKLRLMPKEPTC